MDTLIPSLSQLIEFAVAPVFLLTGIAGFLNVMSSRLGRISDRVRVAEDRFIPFQTRILSIAQRKKLRCYGAG